MKRHLAVRAGLALALVVALVLSLAGTARAGQACEEGKPTVRELAAGMELAAHTAAALDASGAKVVLLARAGQDLSRYGLRWSHFAFAYRQDDGAWRVVHKLNTCATTQANLFRQGLGQFFNDRPFRYEAAFVVPTPELQQRLLPLLQDNTALARLHQPRYSMVAYAFGTRYQQSNQWALETLAMAAEPGANTSRSQAQAWLRWQGYRPGVLHLDTFTRLGARLTRANIEFDDHPTGDRFAGHIATVTVDSVFDWLARTQRAGAVQTLR
jgi:hypothetical protein